MVTGCEVVEFARRLDNLLDPWVAELDDITRIHIYQVVVLHATVCLFELGNVFAKLMFYHQTAVQQQFNGIVKCGPAYPVVLILHKNI